MLTYTLSDELLGEGMFGKVYKGHHSLTGEIVAIKVTSKKMLAQNLKKKSQLEKEISFMKQICHENIVRLIDSEMTATNVHMILEFCEGGDLAHRLLREPGRKLPEPIAKKYLQQLAAGMHCIWSNNLIHRDLKPQNLLLSTSNDATAVLKIADFGFVRQLGPATLAETQCGSPLYMAPEILDGRHYDSKCDLWSVGVILFQMVTGEPPYKGRDTNDLRNNLRRKPVVLPKGVDLSLACKSLLRRLLVKNALQRCSYEEFFNSEFLASKGSGKPLSPLDTSLIPGALHTLEPIEEVALSPPTPSFRKTKETKEPGYDSGPSGVGSFRLNKEDSINSIIRSLKIANAQAAASLQGQSLQQQKVLHAEQRVYRRSYSDPSQVSFIAQGKLLGPAMTAPTPSPPLPSTPILQKRGSRSLPASPQLLSTPPRVVPSHMSISAAPKSLPQPTANTAVPRKRNVPFFGCQSSQAPTTRVFSSMCSTVREDKTIDGLSPSASGDDWVQVEVHNLKSGSPLSAGIAACAGGSGAGSEKPQVSHMGMAATERKSSLAKESIPQETTTVGAWLGVAGPQILSLVALADAKVLNALSQESEAAMAEVLCEAEEKSCTPPKGNIGEKAAQLYVEGLTLYLSALRMIQKALVEARNFQGAFPTACMELMNQYQAVLQRAKECRAKIPSREKLEKKTQQSTPQILLHSSQTLAKAAHIKELLGQDNESQEKYRQATILMEILLLQCKVALPESD